MATVVITPRGSVSNYSPNSNYEFNIQWTGGSSGFDINDLSITNGILRDRFVINFGSGRYIIRIRTGGGAGNRTEITIRANAVSQGNSEYTYGFNYGTGPPTQLTPTTLAIVSGNNQSAQINTALANPLVVQVNDQNGDPLEDITVNFTTTGGTLSSASETTDANGRASVNLTMPSRAESVTVTAAVSGLTSVNFAATATERPPTPTPRTPTITWNATRLQSNQTAIATIRWPVALPTNDFISSEINVSGNGIKGTFSGSGAVYTLRVSAPTTGSGTIRVTIPANVITDGNPEVSAQLSYTEAIPDVVIEPTLAELQILTIPGPGLNGALYLTEVDLNADPPDPIEKNDIEVLFVFNQNVSDLSLTHMILTAENDLGNDVSDEVSFVNALRGKGCVYSVTLRFPNSGRSGQVTLTVLENNVAEGNPETTVTINYSNDFPRADWDILFQPDATPDTDGITSYNQIVSIDSEYIYLRYLSEVHVFDWAENRIEGREATTAPNNANSNRTMRFDTESYLTISGRKLILYRKNRPVWESENILPAVTTERGWTLTEDGKILIASRSGNEGSIELSALPIETVHIAIAQDSDLENTMLESVSLSNGDADDLNDKVTWYLASSLNENFVEERTTGDHYIHVYNEAYQLIPNHRIPVPREFITFAPTSLFYFNKLLFRLDTAGFLRFLDVSKWRLPQPVSTIYPQEVAPGQRIDLSKFMHNAIDIVFDIGSEKPDWLSIEENRYLVISEDAPIGGAGYVQVRGINSVGGSELNACGFYVSVTGVAVPVWKEISTMTLTATQEVNLLEYVEGADFVEWVYGSTVPEGLELVDDSVLRVASGSDITGTHQVSLRAGTHRGFFADAVFGVTVLSEPELVSITDVQGYEVFIEGIDVTAHIDGENLPEISNNLDWVRLNQFTRGRCVVTLRSDSENGGYFNETNPDSFWKTHSLNESGYLNEVQVFVNLRLPDGRVQSKEIFKGVIFEVDDRLGVGRVGLQCIDSSYVLKNLQVSETVAGVPKLLELSAADEEAQVEGFPVVEGRYTVEDTFGAMIPKGSAADVHTTALLLKAIQNAPEGVTEDDTAFMTESEVRTQGGYLSISEDRTPIPVLVKTQTPHRYLSPQAAIEKLVKQEPVLLTVHATEPEATGAAHIRSNGNLAFPVERGRLLRYPVDWIVDAENGVFYYLLSNPVNYISDALVCYDVNTETHQVLYEFDPALSVVSFASSDFDTFMVIVTDATDFDRSVDPIPKVPQSVVLGYDASVSENTHIVSYQQSTHHYRTLLEKDTDFRPQTGLHYWIGSNNVDYAWQGITRGVRGAFRYRGTDGSFVYRYAKGMEFGIARIGIENPSHRVSAIFTRSRDAYQNHLNFAFDVTEAGEVFFAAVEGTGTTSTLTVEKWTDGTTETVFERTEPLYQLTEFDTAGGAWLGVHEVLVDGHNIYLIVPVSRNGRDISTDAGVILYRYNQVTLQLQVLAKYDFVQYGPCMLTKHDGDIYFVESPAVSYLFEARNRDVVFDASEAKGFLKRIHATGEIETLGNVYFDNDRAYRGHLPMRSLSFDDDLHFVMGYGDPASIGQPESDASRPENWQWFSFGKQYRYKVPVLPTAGAISEVLTSLATTVGATVSIDKNILSLQNRRARGAFVAAETVGVADTEIAYAFANHAFPAMGYLLIGSELVRYTGRTATHFTGVSRGELATPITTHAEDSLITFVHRPIEARNTMRSSEPYLEVTVSLDSDHLYNSIEEGSPVRSRVLDAASQSQFGSNPLQLALSTTEHELPWVEFISKQYLERFKDLAYLINVRVRAFYAVNLGEIVCFKYLADAPEVDGYLIAMQVMSVRTGSEFTTIRGRQVTPVVTPEVVRSADLTRHYLTTDGAGTSLLVDGAGNPPLYFGDALYFDVAPTFEVSELPKLTLVQYAEMTPVVLPAGVSPIGNPFTYTFSPALGKGLRFDPRTRTLSGTPIAVMAETDYVYTATDTEGQVILLRQPIEVMPAVQVPLHITDGEGNLFFADGEGTVIRWHGF